MIETDISGVKNDECLVIPTYRIKEATQTVIRYKENFKNHGHKIAIMVFDDSPAGQTTEKDISAFKNHDYKGDIYYIGAEQKKKFIESLIEKTGIDSELLNPIFAPSYGGNRNSTLVYSLGKKMITVDDDVYPFGLFIDSEGLKGNEVAKGKFVESGENGYRKEEQDILSAFREALGKKVAELNWDKGKYIEDSAMDLLSNISKDGLSDNVLHLIPGEVYPEKVIKQVQTFRTGSPDIDTKDYINEFFANPDLIMVNDLSKIYALSDYKPCVTDLNWRVDSGVSGLDNRQGLPPFIPTTLRFEDYIFRLWLQKEDLASAHIDAVQNHKRSQKNRSPLADDYLNEEMTALMKKQLRKLIKTIEPLKINFYEELKIEDKDLAEINIEAHKLFNKARKKAKENLKSKQHFDDFARLLFKNFLKFGEKNFIHKMKDKLNEEFDILRQTMDIWPQIIEVCSKTPRPAIKI